MTLTLGVIFADYELPYFLPSPLDRELEIETGVGEGLEGMLRYFPTLLYVSIDSYDKYLL